MLLKRFCSDPDVGTFGRLYVSGEQFFTVEKPWKDNEPFLSCVPVGEYALIPYTSERYGNTFKLVNKELNVFPDFVNDEVRDKIIIHPGNTMDDVQGCIAVGDSLWYHNDKWAVANSRVTFHKLQELWHKQKPLKMVIENV